MPQGWKGEKNQVDGEKRTHNALLRMILVHIKNLQLDTTILNGHLVWGGGSREGEGAVKCNM